jgi:hypothetical protein
VHTAATTADAVLRDAVARAAGLAAGHTHGRGFSRDGRHVQSELAGLIRAAVVRALSNPELPLACSAPPFGGIPGSFADWTLDEVATLTRFGEARLTVDDAARSSQPTEASGCARP